MKDAREVGLKLILSSWKELIWYRKTAHLTKEKLKGGDAATLKNVNLLQKLIALILSVVDGLRYQRNK
jgi:hypothetical protein